MAYLVLNKVVICSRGG